MPFSTSGINMMLNAFKGTNPSTPCTYVSLHSSNPGDTGTGEITGGSPAYARKSITFNTAASKSMTASNQPVFDVPAGTTVGYVGFWSAVTGGTYLGYATITSETFAAQGTYTLTSVTLSIS